MYRRYLSVILVLIVNSASQCYLCKREQSVSVSSLIDFNLGYYLCSTRILEIVVFGFDSKLKSFFGKDPIKDSKVIEKIQVLTHTRTYYGTFPLLCCIFCPIIGWIICMTSLRQDHYCTRCNARIATLA